MQLETAATQANFVGVVLAKINENNERDCEKKKTLQWPSHKFTEASKLSTPNIFFRFKGALPLITLFN